MENNNQLIQFQEQCPNIIFKGNVCSLSVKGCTFAETSSPHHHPRPGLQSITITLENCNTLDVWSAVFTDSYLEDITRKTGNYKRFPVLVEMLLSALKKNNATVSLDIMTLDDLAAVKHSNPLKEQVTLDSKQEKLYLILTYAVAFDRVHYPLPLLFDQNQNPAALKKQVRMLNRKIAQLVEERESSMEEITRLLKQNDKLKHDMKVNRLSLASMPLMPRGKLLPEMLDAIKAEAADEIDAIYHQIEVISNLNSGLQVSRIDRHLTRLQSIIQTLIAEAAKPSGKTLLSASRTQPSVLQRERSSSRGVSGPGYSSRGRSQSANKSSFGPTMPHSRASRPTQKKNIPASRSSSVSSFARFDPTAYIQERERKMAARRSNSRSRHERSSSLNSVRSYQSAISAQSGRSGRSSIRSAATSAKSSASIKDSRRTSAGNAPAYRLSNSSKPKDKNRQPAKQNEISPSLPKQSSTYRRISSLSDTSDIDERLEKIQSYLAGAQLS